MANYKQSTIVGDTWKRAFQVLIDNRLETIPRITYSEETVVVSNDEVLAKLYGDAVSCEFTTENALTPFQLRNPQTNEPIGVNGKFQDLYILIYSLYFHLVNIRDSGVEPPYPSWTGYDDVNKVWLPPVSKPTDQNEYIWREDLTNWIVAPLYSTWNYNETTGEWESPVPMPIEGGPYIWNDKLNNWIPQPYSSWTHNTITQTWDAPIIKPDDRNQYIWREDLLNWIVESPYQSWTYNINSQEWEAPVPMPTEGGPYEWNESTLTWDVIE